MTAIPGTNIAAPLAPFDTADTHPTHDAKYGKGGWRSVATIAERDAIPAPRRTVGMVVQVTNDPTTANNGEWEWDGAAWIVALLRQRVEDLEDSATELEATVSRSTVRRETSTVSDRSNGAGIDVLAGDNPQAVIGVVGDTGQKSHVIDTRARSLIDFFGRTIGKHLRFPGTGIASRIMDFLVFDVIGKVTFRGYEGVELSISRDEVRIKSGFGELKFEESGLALYSRAGATITMSEKGAALEELGRIEIAGKTALVRRGAGVSRRVDGFEECDVFGAVAWRAENGDELSVSAEGIRLSLSEQAPETGAFLWRHPSGRLMSRVIRPYYTGEIDYLGLDPAPLKRAPTVPWILPAADNTEYATRLYQGMPSIAWVNGRLWSAFQGNKRYNNEAYDDYVILKYSDDDGVTWIEWAYWVQDTDVSRLNAAHLWVDPNGKLWVFAAADVPGEATDMFGTWAFSIKDPLADKPTISTMWRALTAGMPSCVFEIDELACICGELKGTSTTDPYVGMTIYDFDYLGRTLTKIGKVPPKTGDVDYPEVSVAQLVDGSLMAVFRTTTGQYVSKSADGRPDSWSTPESLFPVIGDNPNSRACIKRTPKGNLIFAYNNHASRYNMTLALLNDTGSSVIHKLVLDGRTSGPHLTYPDITFDDAGKIYVVWDDGRNTYKRIAMAIVEESDFVENGSAAAITFRTIDVQ